MESKDLPPKKGTVGRLLDPLHPNPPPDHHPLTCADWLRTCALRVAEYGPDPDPDLVEQHIGNVKDLLRCVSEIWGHSFIAGAIGATPRSFGIAPILDLTQRAAPSLETGLHALWSRATADPAYDKPRWVEFQAKLQGADVLIGDLQRVLRNVAPPTVDSDGPKG